MERVKMEALASFFQGMQHHEEVEMTKDEQRQMDIDFANMSLDRLAGDLFEEAASVLHDEEFPEDDVEPFALGCGMIVGRYMSYKLKQAYESGIEEGKRPGR